MDNPGKTNFTEFCFKRERERLSAEEKGGYKIRSNALSRIESKGRAGWD